MKKILMIVTIAVFFGGCATPQEGIDNYLKARDKAVISAKVLKCEKDCSDDCNEKTNTIDRVDCKMSCFEVCE